MEEKIFEVAEIAKFGNEEYEQYIFSLKTYRDYKNSMDTARDEGRAEGKAEGRAENTIEIAKKLKTRGMPSDQINEITGLSIGEIEKL